MSALPKYGIDESSFIRGTYYLVEHENKPDKTFRLGPGGMINQIKGLKLTLTEQQFIKAFFQI